MAQGPTELAFGLRVRGAAGLGSLWLNRTNTSDVQNLGGWLTTVVARVSLNMLRSRNVRREEPIGVRVPEPIVDRADGIDPEHEAQALSYSRLGLLVQPALVNGVAGAVSTLDGEPFSVGGVTVRGGKIVAIDILADLDRLRRLDLTILDG